jgi:thermitase
MWLGLTLASAALLSTAALAEGPPDPGAGAPAPCAPDEVLVKFRPGADPAIVSARHGGTITSEIAGIQVYVVAVPPGTVMEKVAALGADPEVEYAEPNAIVRIPEAPPPDPGSCP